MYLEKRVFVGISTLLQALFLGGGRGGKVVMNEIAILRPFKNISVISGRWEMIMNGCFQWDPVNV